MFTIICCRSEDKGHRAYYVIAMHTALLLDYGENWYYASGLILMMLSVVLALTSEDLNPDCISQVRSIQFQISEKAFSHVIKVLCIRA